MTWFNRYADPVYCLIRLIAAFLASGEMAVAYFMVSFTGRAIGHAPNAMERILPILNKGELPVLFCFVFFIIIFYGSGCWSIDALIRTRSTSSA